MATYTENLSLHPNHAVSAVLVDNASNIAELKSLIMNQTIDACLIRPPMIADRFQLMVAANRALHLHLQNKRITKTLHSEVLFSLSISKNITDCFKKFGASDDDKSLIILEIHERGQSRLDDLVLPKVKGELIPFDDLPKYSNHDLIKKVYKIKEDSEKKSSSLLDSVVCRISSQDFVST
ncbi:hypothetical protein CAPTEDRAFT_172400 [Capitella teleta]|uniref:EKC/KEOPS complex subunit cgi121 n=1 Tax=Capitella teleta TaxID=283909 RepID=R7VB93_CAPTE|nr:hypothetical protein CAPTEDRAFT_172400 [Capitella teleta]|eukprot:ELU15894.1 hypothetical protein CAPTEDRAFT_172400 [Capitella teleta]